MIRCKSVLDVGCGVGLVSLTTSICGANGVIAADISPIVLKLTEKAAHEINISNINTLQFDICSGVPLPEADITIFSDMLYTIPLSKAVARRVIEAYRRGSWVLIVRKY